MKKYFIIGSGRQGPAAAYDIVKFGAPKSLTIIDLNLENLNKCKAIIQPMGSKNDNKAIKLVNEKKIALYFTNFRFFKH